MGKTLNIAHRGASGNFPENTLAAFLAAADQGADMCELDVQSTRDGAVVVIHDETVDRTTTGSGAVANLTLDQIGRLDAGAKFGHQFHGLSVPTLEDVFVALGGKLGLNIEIKQGGAVQRICRAVCDLIREFDALQTSMVSSFDWAALAEVRRIDPAVRIGLLAEQDREKLVASAMQMGAYAVNPRFDLVDAGFCRHAHARGLKLLVWTVDLPEAMRALIDWGVDGIITNCPARLAQVAAGR